MNPLQKLIQDEMHSQNIKRSELCKRMGYRNVSKCLRNVDEMMETLENREWMPTVTSKSVENP